MDNCHLQADFFYNNFHNILDEFAPIEEHKYKCNDRPWVTSYFKDLISQRNLAFSMHRTVLYKRLRNRVNRVRKSLQTQFFLIKLTA